MSGKSVGVDTGETTPDHEGSDADLRTLVRDAVGDTAVTEIVYRENTGTLSAPDTEWSRFDAVADLPDGGVTGWDELYVYTESHVYRWLGVGFGNGPERLPRNPEDLPGRG